MKRPFTRYRPLRTKDGKGGYSESLADPVVVWGEIKRKEEGIQVVIDANEDVLTGDVIRFEEA